MYNELFGELFSMMQESQFILVAGAVYIVLVACLSHNNVKAKRVAWAGGIGLSLAILFFQTAGTETAALNTAVWPTIENGYAGHLIFIFFLLLAESFSSWKWAEWAAVTILAFLSFKAGYSRNEWGEILFNGQLLSLFSIGIVTP